MVVHVPEIQEFSGIDEGQVSIRKLIEHLTDRTDCATYLDELSLQREDASQRFAIRPLHHGILQGIDRILEPVGEREVGIDDLVADGPQQMVRPGPHDSGDAAPKMRAASRVPGGRMAGKQEPVADHQVDLVRLKVGRIIECEQHDVDEIVGRLQLRALIAFDDVLGDEGVQSEQIRGAGDLRRRWVGQINPDHPLPAARLVQQPLEVFEGGRVMEIADDSVNQQREGHIAVMCRPFVRKGSRRGRIHGSSRIRGRRRASAGTSAIAVTAAATKKTPTRIRPASCAAHRSSA